MLRPIKIILPQEQHRNIKHPAVLPARLQKFPFADWDYAISDQAELVCYFVDNDDHWIELVSASLYTGGTLGLNIKTPFLCIAFMLEGSISDQRLGQGVVNLPADNMKAFYLPAGDHRIAIEKGDISVLFIVPPLKLMERMIREHQTLAKLNEHLSVNSRHGAMIHDFSFPSSVRAVLNQLEKSKEDTDSLYITFNGYCAQMTAMYNRSLNSVKHALQGLSGKEKAMEIQDHILNNLESPDLGRLADICRLFRITSKTLSREFKLLTGYPVSKYIKDQRLQYAYRLLEETNESETDIAFRVGYPDLSNFIRDFKMKYNYLPGSVRKKNKPGE